MSWWKQILLSFVILLAAAALWYQFVPGARETVANLGLAQGPAAAAPSPGGGEARAGARRRGGGGGMQAAIVSAPVTSATINDRLTAIGNGKALHTVAVRSFASGRVTEIPVAPGARVNAGDVIARMDDESERIAVDRAQLALDNARTALERITTLRASNAATAVQETDAELAVRNAELALREAQLALDRRLIVAPIAGTVGILPISAGDYITSTSDIAVIDDRSEILVDFWVPERYARLIEIGMPVKAESIARPNETYEGVVSAIDNQVDTASRTLHMQGRIANPDDALRSGMAFRVTMEFPGDSFPAVDPLAVQWSTEGPFVWAVREGTARRLPVRVIQRNSDSILVDGDFLDGDQVVVEGVHAVREGQPIAVAGNDAAPRASGS